MKVEALPYDIRLELDAITKIGYYKSEEEFIRDAINTILSARMDLRILIAIKLYEEDKVSLGKASEIARTDYETMKKLLLEKGIKIRRGSESVEEMERKAKRLIELRNSL